MAYKRYNNKSDSKTVSSGSSLSKAISENKTMAAAFLLILLVLFFLLVLRKDSRTGPEDRRIEVHGLSKRSAFNLTASKHTYSAGSGRSSGSSYSGSGRYAGTGSSSSSSSRSNSLFSRRGSSGDYFDRATASDFDTRGGTLGVSENRDAIEDELNAINDKMLKTPKKIKYPLGASKNVRDMIDVEYDDDYMFALTYLESNQHDKAEEAFRKMIENASGNKFKELYGWGGLMEIYEIAGDRAKFRQAFGEYAKKAQELKEIYGPLADSVAAAYKTFESIQSADSGSVRQQLSQYNLKHNTNYKYEDIMGAYAELKDWFPNNLEMSPEYKKIYKTMKR